MPPYPIRRRTVRPWIGRVTGGVLALAFALAFAATPQPGPNDNQQHPNPPANEEDHGKRSNVNWNS